LQVGADSERKREYGIEILREGFVASLFSFKLK